MATQDRITLSCVDCGAQLEYESWERPAEPCCAGCVSRRTSTSAITVGATVRTPTRPSYAGTVIADHGNGIVRVEWHGITRRGDREVGENPRKRYPYVSDVGVVALERVER